MADERIDVVVTDKVDGNVEKKLRGIADAADRGETYLNRLKSALASVNSSSVDRLAAAMAKADTAQAKLISAQARLTNAQNAGSVAAQKVALSQQKIATEAARTEAAQARAAAATLASERAAVALATAQDRATVTSLQAAAAQQKLAGATAQAGAAATASGNGFRNYVASIQAGNNAALSSGAATTGMAGGLNTATNASHAYARAARTTTHANANIIAQLQDIGVSLAGGQNPLLVAIQQGSQLSYIATTLDGGVKALLATILRMLAPFALLAAAAGALFVSFRNFSNDIASKHEPALQQYAQSLGLSEKEMKKLSNTTVDASGKLKEFDQITITSADSWNGFVTTVREGLDGMVAGWGPLNEYFSSAWEGTMSFLRLTFLGFFALVRTTLEVLGKLFVNVFKIAANTVIGVFNGTVLALRGVANIAIDFLNEISGSANAVLEFFGFDALIPSIDRFQGKVQNLTDNMYQLESIDIGGSLRDNVLEADATLRGFAARWETNAANAARDRIRNAANAIIDNRSPGASRSAAGGRESKTQADYINETNVALDNQLSRMKLLKDAREVQQRLDQIEQEFIRRRMPLDQQQLDVFKEKITVIQDFSYIQREMDRIFEDSIGPMRAHESALQAITILQREGVVSTQQASEQQVLANRAYAEAVNPLMQMQEQLTQAEGASRLYGQAVQEAAFYEQIRQAYLQRGVILGQNSTAAINAEVTALMNRNSALLQQQYIQSQIASIVDPLSQEQLMLENKSAFYAEIERLRQEDLISEENAKRALASLDAKYAELRLAGVSSFFGELAGLSSSGNKRLAAIGKAAAVAQATIDGFVAVQKALASAPPPLNFALAGAVALRTGAQVSGILSTNAGSFATGGDFMVQGRSGIDNNNINMNVSRGERVVVQTPAQQRESMNNSGPSNVEVPVTVNNMLDREDLADAVTSSDQFERKVLNIIRSNPKAGGE